MDNTSDHHTLRDYFGVLRAQKWVIVAVTLVALCAGVGYSVAKHPTYQATAQLQFTDPSAELSVLATTQLPADLQPDKTVAADSTIVTRADVVAAVHRRLARFGLTANQLRKDVQAAVQPNSNLVQITATSHNARLAAVIANAFAYRTRGAERTASRAGYAAQALRLQATMGGLSDPAVANAYQTAIARLRILANVANPVRIARAATVPTSASSPKPVVDTVLAGFLGLILGVLLAAVRNSLDRRISDSHAAQHELGLPLVGYVRTDSLGLGAGNHNGNGVVADADLEAFRILRRNVDFLARDGELSTVVVTSALPQEGKSTVAAWYAYVNAVAGRRTMLVECDFRRPVLAERFKVPGTPGLSDFIAGDAHPQEVLQCVPVKGREAVKVLSLVPAGESIYQPAEMIASSRFAEFVEEVSGSYDLVVFDSAPLLSVSDTLELIPLVQRVLFCVRLGQTTREQARAAQQAIQHLPSRPTGLVITGVRPRSGDDYYGYYSYAPRGDEVHAGA